MRIGMILDKTFPPDPRVENEAVTLVENGFEVFLFCLKYNNDQLAKETLNGVEIRRYQSNKLEYKLSALAYTFPFYTNSMRRKINSFIKENDIKALHIHDIRIAEAVFKANKKTKLPTILDLHDNMPEIMKLYPHLNKFPGKFLISPKKWKQKEEEFINKATKVVTVSNEFKDEVVKRTKIDESKIEVIPNTVRKSFYENFDTEDEVLNKYKDDFVVLYLGDTGLRRGLLTAIEAVHLLKETIKNVKLVIVGTNTTDTILKQKVKDLNIEKYVDFQGWKDVKLFASYIMASKICISPLHRNIQHNVAYPNKLFQYMSFEKTVLVSNANAQKNLIENNNAGLVHVEKDSNDFADKVIQLFESEELRSQLGANGKKFIQQEFYWEKTSKELVKVYKELEN